MLELFKSKLGKGKIIKSLGKGDTPKPTRIFAIDIETSGHDKLPGDSPMYPHHGIAGVSICNMLGDAAYFVVNDKRDYGGIPVNDMIRYIDQFWMDQASVVALHHGKFDLGFLFSRYLRQMPFYDGRIRVYDTWVANTIRNRGVYQSSKLKELMRTVFKIETGTEAVKDKWLEEHQTKDYGDVPLELMGAYAADDVIYTMILMLCQPPLTAEQFQVHDLYVRNCLHLIRAELHGVCVNVERMQACMIAVKEQAAKWRVKLESLLAGTDVKVDDDQAVMKYLNTKNLYGGPRMVFGESKYVFDEEELCMLLDVPLVEAFYQYQRRAYFAHCFSGAGAMATRMMNAEGCVGYYPGHYPSMNAKGGIPQVKAPDITDRVPLDDEIRALFVPRPGKRLVSVQLCNVPTMLLGYYAQDAELCLAAATGTAAIIELLQRRLGVRAEALPPLLRQIVEGSGFALLERRLKARKIPVGNRQHYDMADKLKAALPNYGNLIARLGETLTGQGYIRDIYGRPILVPEDKRWRTLATLLQSSTGEVSSVYLDLLCKLAYKLDASLLLAHENEFLFETGNDDFAKQVAVLTQQSVLPIVPQIVVNSAWKKITDAHLLR